MSEALGGWIWLGILSLVVAQRLTELRRSRRNEEWARAQGAVEHGKAHYPLFFLLHGGWLLGWSLEAWLRGPELAPTWPIWTGLFILAQGLRYWAILILGPRWTTRILVLPGRPPVRHGPYRFIRHPNYVAVAIELFAVPMLFGAWVTAVVAGVLNALLLLRVRIPEEERALKLGLILLLPVALGSGWAEDRAPVQPASITYQLRPSAEVLEDDLSAEELRVLQMLNRVDGERIGRMDQVVVPEPWELNPMAHSPFPQEFPSEEAMEKLLVVHQPLQVFGAFENGRLVRWGPVSTGRRDHPTPTGRFFLTWRSRGRHSTVNPEWYLEWYFNFHNERGISFHQYELPGEPASHACVRLLEEDARWIYEWGDGWTLDERGWEVLEEGTPVWILGEYDFDASPPWLSSQRPHPPVPREQLEAGP